MGGHGGGLGEGPKHPTRANVARPGWYPTTRRHAMSRPEKETRMSRQNYRDRIVGRGAVDPVTLAENPRNWRRHSKAQGAALDGLLSAVGWVREILVNQRTGNLVDGHLRLRLALERKEPSVPVTYIDLAPEEEFWCWRVWIRSRRWRTTTRNAWMRS